jgi:hypothetical protein
MNPRATSRRPASRALPGSMRRAAAAAATLALLAGTAACSSGSSGAGSEPPPPATIDAPAKGGPAKVTLTEDAMRRIDLHTTTVRHERVPVAGRVTSSIVVPYAAVIYDGDGTSWAYAEIAPRVFLRKPISVAEVQGNVAVLSKGPADGTAVVTVGAPLLLGAEAQIAGEE